MIAEQNQDIMGYLDGTPEYKLYPPKDDLVDTVSIFFGSWTFRLVVCKSN